MNQEPRGCLGAVYRITNDFLTERGLAGEVKAQLSPESRKVLDKPPFAFVWLENAPLEEIEKVLYARSPHLAADLGFAAAKLLSSGLIAPVFRMALSLFGQTVESLFNNLDRFYSMVVRGFSFRYERGGDKQGQVFAKITGGPVHPSLYQQIRGNLLMMYALVDVHGTVSEPVVLRSDESGAEIALQVSWQ